MAGATPDEAIEAFVKRIRASLRCITEAVAIVSPGAADEPRALALFAEGQDEPGKIRLPTHCGQGDLFLRVAHSITIRHVPDDKERGPYKVSSSFYQYVVLDYGGNEIVAYDWHPDGRGARRTPHIHVSCVGSHCLTQREGSALRGAKTYVWSFHLPTGRVLLEDIIELLIDEFRVDPLSADWRDIIQDNREAVRRGRTWS